METTVKSQDVKGVTFTCAGPRVLSPELYDACIAKRAKLDAAGDHASLVAFARNLAVTMQRADKLSDKPTTAEVAEQLVTLTNARKGCGTNTTALVEAFPFDGETHDVKCPTCGTVSKVVRTPRHGDDVKAIAAKRYAKLADVLK